jgi:flavorubredoxin
MQTPPSYTARRVAADCTQIGTHLPIPALGQLPCNAFVIHAREPVLVDTGIAAARASFLAALGRTVDPADLRWIWVTHTDPDHVGNLAEVLALAPRARVVTTFLGMGKMGLLGLPQERAFLLNPGQSLEVGDRALVALQPPVFDAPETTALFDPAARTLFCADAFGALLERPAATADEAGRSLREGLIAWATIDVPWLARTEARPLQRALTDLAGLAPASIVGGHMPPARGQLLPALSDYLLAARTAPAFTGPDQAQLEAAIAMAQAA